jgi:multidrug resistance efflux pump
MTIPLTDYGTGTISSQGAAADAGPTLSDRVRSLRLPAEVVANHPSRRWRALAGIVVALAILGTVVYLATRDHSEAATTAAAPPAAAAPAPLADSGEIANQAKGYIVPARQVLVSPQVSGRIVRLTTENGEPIQEGMRVNKGEVLAVIEDTEYRAERDRAKAIRDIATWTAKELDTGFRPEEKAQAMAELNEAETQLEYLRSLTDRYRRLLQTNTIPQDQFDDALTRLTAAQHRVDRLRNAWTLMRDGAREERRQIAAAELARAEAELAKAEWRLTNCTIRAPITGTILRKNAEEGNLVNPIAMQGSYSLCEMADLSDLEVDLSIQERDVGGIFVGQKCKIRTEAYDKREDFGHVSRLMPIADRAKGTISVRVKITSIKPEEEGVYLKPEMSTLVTFLKQHATPQ